eukprot:1179653-Prorocentrum_minimum.AAC.8
MRLMRMQPVDGKRMGGFWGVDAGTRPESLAPKASGSWQYIRPDLPGGVNDKQVQPVRNQG